MCLAVMPRSTVAHPKIQGVAERGETGDGDWVVPGCDGERVDEVVEGKSAPTTQEQQSSTHEQDQHKLWCPAVRTLHPCSSSAAVAAVLSACQLETLLHLSASPVEVCCRLLLLCVLWLVLGVCVHALQRRLRPGPTQGEPPPRKHQEIVSENKSEQYSCMSDRSPEPCAALSLALADGLLLCVLQEPLPDPGVPHIQALCSRLEAVSHTLSEAGVGSEAVNEADPGSALTGKLTLLCTYLQQRAASLRALIQVQGDLEAAAKGVLQGLDSLWAQLEELHAGVTLTKREGHGPRDLASTQTDAETLFGHVCHYESRLHTCRAHLADSTRLLQELTWSHAHVSSAARCSSESVWPELLLQSNIEQFDDVQERFMGLEQQTSTFQAHLRGLGKGNQEGPAGALTQANGAQSGHKCSTPVDPDPHTPPSLGGRKRLALQISSALGCLHKTGKKK